MLKRLLPFSLLIGSQVMAQTQNALDFDGADDQVIVPNASGLVANSPGMSLACWVYPRNPAPNFPDFDGIAGFRNELDCDFYLLHFTPTTIEARLRNSASEIFTVTGGALQLNTWQLVVLTYDGSTLSLWINGALSGSVPASGSIINTTVPLQIGDLTYQITDYWLDGRVDEVTLWKRSLSIAEIQCLQSVAPNPGDPDLMLYFNCDQGFPGGNNSGVSSLTDLTGHINGTFEGLALNGASSNFVTGTGFGSTITATICPSTTYEFNGQLLGLAGVYTASFPTGGACDSVVTLTLNVVQVNTNVLQNGEVLTCLNGTAQWQWLDCDNGYAVIPGATFQSYIAAENGSYAVRVTANGCADTSACLSVNSIGIEDLGMASQIHLASTLVQHDVILMPENVTGELHVMITDAQGRILRSHTQRAEARMTFEVLDLPAGSYVLRVGIGAATKSLRFLKL